VGVRLCCAVVSGEVCYWEVEDMCIRVGVAWAVSVVGLHLRAWFGIGIILGSELGSLVCRDA